jgi:hypothetical protein
MGLRISQAFKDLTSVKDAKLKAASKSITIDRGNIQKVPWGTNLGKDAFFKSYEIKPDRWTRVYPYRLMVIDVRTNRIVSQKNGGVATASQAYYFENGTSQILSTIGNAGKWVFTFPLTPQQISIVDQYAINTIPTMRGVTEYHNGVKFKMINIVGTTGLWPRKPVIAGNLNSPSSLQSIFGGTIEKATQVADQFKKIFPKTKTQLTKKETVTNTDDEFETGYYQALLLSQFIERYTTEKKKPQNKYWRLVWDMPKENQSFVVTPMIFNSDKNQQKPAEYKFNIQLKAWKRIDLNIEQAGGKTNVPKLTPNVYQSVLGGIRNARRTLSTAKNLIQAVRSDVTKPLEALRQTALAVKDASGVATTAADCTKDVINSYQYSIKDSMNIIKNSWKDAAATIGLTSASSNSSSGTGFNAIPSAFNSKSNSSTDNGASAAAAIIAEQAQFEGMPSSLVADNALGQDMAQTQLSSDTNNIFANPEENFDLFDNITIDQLQLSTEQRAAFNEELDKVRLLTVDDFREFRNDILSLALDISNNYGAGNSVYAQIYGLPTPKTRDIPMTLEENDTLNSIFEAVQAYDSLINSKQWDDDKTSNPLEYVGGLANQVGINFDIPPSKFLVPVPYGLTIEQIAARYLQNPDKWIEIATINNLRSPYIDETGFSYNLLSNAEGRQFTVDDTNGKIFIGQSITLQSSTIPMFIRNVTNVEKIGDGNYLVTVDGEATLDNLKTVNGAKMKGYLPGTVNSQNQIYIPTDEASDEDDRSFEINGLDQQYLTKLSKIDWMLTDNGDIALDSVGDFRLANGLNNLIQALKIKVRTKKGTLLRHLDYGLGLTHGVSVADIENGEILNTMNKMIQDDPRFDSIERIDLILNGPTLAIDMAVNIANQRGIVPVTFNMKL